MGKPRRTPEVQLIMQEDRLNKVKQIVDPFLLSDVQVKQVMDTLLAEMFYGLSRDPEIRKKTSLQMENTYVRSLLNGKEDGDFLALDLGGTNFRVLLVKMRQGKCESISKNYNVPVQKLTGPSKDVFDHLAESIFKFLSDEGLTAHKLPLGFCFSFPMVQEGLNKGILVTWTKSFACPDGVGEDAVRMLEDAIARRGDTSVEVVAVLNDTTGTLLAGSYLDKECNIGLIMGTGCNAAYVETLENIDKWKGPICDPKIVVIDTEWGAFGDNGCLNFVKTEFDNIVDAHSNHVGSFTFEKLFSGHYIGDLVRLVLLKLTKEGLLFKEDCTSKLEKWTSISCAHISEIDRDTETDTKNTQKMLQNLGLDEDATKEDILIVRYICGAVAVRAAQLISACLAVLLNHTKKERATIAIDGSLYRYHPRLHDMMVDWLHQLAPNTKSKLILAEDGSGRGAAFVAAVACRMEQEKAT